jgi:transposase
MIDLKERGFVLVRENFPGADFYAEEMELKVYLYGYFNGVMTSCKLEKMCHSDIGAIWFTGMHYPDHNTLWRFFKKNKGAFEKVLLEATFSAEQNNLISMVLHALDGTIIRAQVSDSSGWHNN